MAIHISAPPTQGVNVVQRGLELTHRSGATMDSASPAALRTMKPFPIFSARLEDVLHNRLLASAHLTSWQYVVFEDENVVALAEVTQGRSLRYASRQSPVVAEAVLQSLRNAEELDVVKKDDYELRILRVPELYFLAVWLHRASSDVLIPVRPFTKCLPDGVSFSEAQIVDALRPLAQVRFATPDA